jgi:hypothetical protein
LDATPYLPTIWASDISVEMGGGVLFVMGKWPTDNSEIQAHRDPYLQYLSSINWRVGEKRASGKSPHIRFVNAESDEKLIAFVREFGPVIASEVEIMDPNTDQRTSFAHEEAEWVISIAAFQDPAALHRERLIYKAALQLLSELRKGRTQAQISTVRLNVSEIVDGVRHWPEQWEKERKWRAARFHGEPAWHFDSSRLEALVDWQHNVNLDSTSLFGPDPYNSAFDILCALINSFRTKVDHISDRGVETLSWGSLWWGIRPALYLILKSEYLSRGATAKCANDRCGNFFSRERAGALYCDDDCSRQYRQRKYWAKTGAARRAKREKAKKRSRNRKRTS